MKFGSFVKTAGAIALAVSTLAACQTTRTDLAENGECLKPDFINQVSGNGHCLAVDVQVPQSLSASPTLYISINEDEGSGPKWNERHVEHLKEKIVNFSNNPQIIVATLARPGFTNGNGFKSTGYHLRDTIYSEEYGLAIAEAIDSLRSHYKAKTVVAFGHSGGGLTVANILSLSPHTIDIGITSGCVCDVNGRIALHGWRSRPNARSPISFASGTPKDKVVYNLSGSADSNTPSNFIKNYTNTLKATGVENAHFYEIAQTNHDQLKWRLETRTTIAHALGLKLKDEPMAKLPWITGNDMAASK